MLVLELFAAPLSLQFEKHTAHCHWVDAYVDGLLPELLNHVASIYRRVDVADCVEVLMKTNLFVVILNYGQDNRVSLVIILLSVLLLAWLYAIAPSARQNCHL